MKLKRIVALTMVGCLMCLSGCSNGASQKPAATEAPAKITDTKPAESKETKPVATEPITLKIANYAVLEKGYESFWQGIKEGYEKQYPNVTIEWVTAPYGEILNHVINMAGGGDKIDCLFGEDIWIPSLVEAGLAAPMDEILDADFLADYYPSALEAHMMDGAVYGVPLYLTPPVLFYNKDLFEKAGLDPDAPPKTYDEMLQMAEKISELKTDDGNKIYSFGFPTGSVIVVGSYLQGLIKTFGGELLDDDGKINIADEGFLDAFRFLQTLDEKELNPQNAKAKDLRNLFALGQLAMYYDKTGGINGVTSINPEAASFTATACPLSGGKGNGTTVSQSHCFIAMDNGAAHTEAVKNFIQYVITPEILEDYMANIAPAYPAKKAMENMSKVNESEFLAGAKDTVQNIAPSYMFPFVAEFNLELCAMAQAVTMGDQDVETAAKEFETAVQPLLP